MENELPIVPFGKYKGKPVTELIADTGYLGWLKKQDGIEKKYPKIYNIVVNQIIGTNNINSKTPEHNELQNKFLNNNNVFKFINKFFKSKEKLQDLQTFFCSDDFKTYFEPQNISFDKHNEENTRIEKDFEANFNWDIFIKFNSYSLADLVTNEDIEKKERLLFKNKFDKEYEEELEKKCIEFDNEIQLREKYDSIMNGCFVKDKWSNKTKLYSSDDYFHHEKKYIDENGELFKIKHYSVNTMKIQKEDLIQKYTYNKEKRFKDTHYVERFKFYKNLLEKYNINLTGHNFIEEGNQFRIRFTFWESFGGKIVFELKPQVGEDYPCILRKMKNQIKLMTSSRDGYECENIVLLIKRLSLTITTKKQLIEIFKQSGIKVIFTDDLIDEENRDNVLQIENNNNKEELIVRIKLLEEEIIELKKENERIKLLEEEIIELKKGNKNLKRKKKKKRKPKIQLEEDSSSDIEIPVKKKKK